MSFQQEAHPQRLRGGGGGGDDDDDQADVEAPITTPPAQASLENDEDTMDSTIPPLVSSASQLLMEQDTMDTLREERDDATQASQQLEATVQRLDAENATIVQEMEQLLQREKVVLQQQQQQQASDNNNNNNNEDTIAALQEQLRQVAQEKASQTAVLQQLQAELEQLEAEAMASDGQLAQLDTLQEDVARLEQENAALTLLNSNDNNNKSDDGPHQEASAEQTSLLEELTQHVKVLEADGAASAKKAVLLEIVLREKQALQDEVAQLQEQVNGTSTTSTSASVARELPSLSIEEPTALVERLQQDKHALQDQVNQLEDDADAMTDKLVDATEQMTELRDELAQCKDENQVLVQENEVFTQEQAQFEERLEGAMDQLVDATENVAELKADRESYKEGQEVAMEAKEHAERSRRASLTMISSLETTLAQKEADMDTTAAKGVQTKDGLQEKVQELESALAVKDGRLQETQEMVGHLTGDKISLEEQVEANAEEGQQQLQTIAKLGLSLKQSEASVESLRNTIASLEKSNDVGEELKSVLSDKECLSTRVVELEASAAKNQKDVDLARDDFVAEQATKKSLELSLEETGQTVETLRETISMLETTGEDMLKAVEEEKQTLIEELEAKAQEEGASFRQEIKAVTDAKVALETSLKESNATLAGLQETVAMLESTGEDMLNAVEEEERGLIEEKETLESSLNESNRALASLQETVTMLESTGEDMLSAVEEEKRGLVEEKDSVEEQLRESNASVEKLQETITMLESTGEEMLKAVEEEKLALAEEMEANAQEQVEEALATGTAKQKAAGATLDIIRKELQESSVARGKAEASLKEAETTVEKLQDNISMIESEGEDVLKAVEEEKQGLIEQVTALESSLKESEETMTTANEKLASLATEKDHLTTKFDTASEACESAVRDNTSLENELEEAHSELEILREAIAEVEAQQAKFVLDGSASMRSFSVENEEQDATTNRSIGNAEGAIGATNRSLGKTDSESQKLMDQNADLKQKLQALERALFSGALQESQAQLEDTHELTETNAALENEVEALSGTLEKTKEKLEQAQGRFLSLVKNAGEDQGGQTFDGKQILEAKLAQAEADADDLREQVETLISKSSELEMVAEEDEAMLREEVDTVNAWNLALETSADQSNAQLEGARAELEDLRSTKESLEQSLTEAVTKLNALQTTAVPPDNALVEKLRQEKQTLSAKVDLLEECVADQNAKLLELEARVEEHLSRSADLKMRLARKNAQIVELGEQPEGNSPGIQPLDQSSRSLAEPSDKENLGQERKALADKLRQTRAKANSLEESLADESARVTELEVSLDEQLEKSSDLKLRLARKSSIITELEEQLEENPSIAPTPLETPASSADDRVDKAAFEEIEKENQLMTVKLARTEDSLRQERSKIGVFEDKMMDSDIETSELKVRLDEAVGKSADLKMRLARKTATIAELRDELYEQNPGEGVARSLPPLSEMVTSRELPMFEKTTTQFSFDDAQDPFVVKGKTSTRQSLPISLPLVQEESPKATSTGRSLPVTEKSATTGSASAQLQACVKDAIENEALFEQISSLVVLAEKKKKRLKALNDRLEIAMTKTRLPV